MERPAIHVLAMGQSGVGKDTFFATFPKPMLVMHLDGKGQDMPYIDNVHIGRASSVGEYASYQLGQAQVEYRDIVAGDGGFVRVEYYSSNNPTMPDMAPVLESRLSFFAQEQGNWKTVVLGSMSSVAEESRFYDQHILNPQYKDPRKWYGAAAEFVGRAIAAQKSWKCNVAFICHVANQKDDVAGELIYGPDLPGKLSMNAGRSFGEMYHLYVGVDQAGNRQYLVQTHNDGRFAAKTHIKANPICYPTYESLWANWGE